ncbi:adenine phosphoribosyltransferase [Vararia minispora EC-137]|uniref:Adenine phosphoribosyltransferase n=1 Tax=Vararia minispora EC-137 TaxID=1314806 RepID=A0ACB8QA70_9AGAM|nr:adenine phosphoribosyltransferase [Vararia minispora EC-137]
MADVAYIRSLLKEHPDFPKKGIVFLDIFPLFKQPRAVETLLAHLVHHLALSVDSQVDVVVGLDARGFLFGPPLALRLGAAFVPVRKRGKLPGECVRASYVKEYGEDIFEMQADAIQPGQNVVVVDDLIATGGSASAAAELVLKQGGTLREFLFLIELTFLGGTKKLPAPAYSMIKIDD